MSDIIFKLRLEHRNILNVLDLLEDQVHRLEGGAPTDTGLLTLAVAYLKSFPEECHHPKEDLVFQMLRKRNPRLAGTLVDLGLEHERLAEFTDRVSREIAGSASPHALGVLLRQYLDTYRDHLSGEEREFLPAALNTLSRDDFALLDYELFDSKDHLFNDAAETRFDELKYWIKERARQRSMEIPDAVMGPAVDELALLRSIDCVEDFNARMGEHQLQLVAYHAGGYSLQRRGRWLVDIPDCDEGRATWCAYYYWKALARGPAT